jgi:CHASE2 domain-containing sensor protein
VVPQMTWRWIVGLLFIGHGLIHASYLSEPPTPKPGAPQWPFRVDHSPVLSALRLGGRQVKSIATMLVVLVVTGFVTAGLGFLAHQGWWPPVAVAAAVASFLLFVLFYHPWLTFGLVIDIVIVVAVLTIE